MKTHEKTLNLLNFTLAILTMAVLAPFSARAQATWDVTGTWSVEFVLKGFAENVTIHITNEVFYAGSFSGYDGGLAIEGNTSGDGISFYDPGPFGGTTFIGTISTNGDSMGSGNGGYCTETDTGGTWYGFWGASGGPAVQYSQPIFTLEPTSIVTTAGAAVTFTASATGDPIPVYQWQFDGTNISNATNSSYSLSFTSITNLGLYDVTASNSVGTNVSITASLSFLNMQCFPGLVLYGPIGESYIIQEAPILSGGTNWTTITNITLTATQPYIYVDYSAITNQAMFYRAVPL
jgi:hypothetical protein